MYLAQVQVEGPLNLKIPHYVVESLYRKQYWLRLENGTNNIILNNAYNLLNKKKT